jgi:thiamine biosynthesis lipoprotein
MSVIQVETFDALGCGVRIVVADGSAARARAAVEKVLDEVDRTYSRFRADSELARLNARPNETIGVSALLAQAIDTALRAAWLSDGLVDPTVGRHMRLIGYDDDFARIRGRTDRIVLRLEPVAGWRAVEFDLARQTVRVPRGVELDLGSTGKALAADLSAAAAMRAAGARGVLVSLGGDVSVAGTAPAEGWNVLVANDSRTPVDAEGEAVTIRDGAIATSSTTVRRWTRGGVELHHIIDPRKGLPAAAHWRTVSAIAGTCVDANTAATAAIVHGAGAPEWLAQQGIPARLVAEDGVVVRAGGWPLPIEMAAA